MLNKALRLLRVYHDMPQVKLAEELEISKSHLSEIESGKKKPTLSLLERYSTFFDVPMSSILFFSENLESDNSTEKLKKIVSSKVLKLLDFIAERSGAEKNNVNPEI
jgi:transcriptional regulator with XRE-family HTH domain